MNISGTEGAYSGVMLVASAILGVILQMDECAGRLFSLCLCNVGSMLAALPEQPSIFFLPHS